MSVNICKHCKVNEAMNGLPYCQACLNSKDLSFRDEILPNALPFASKVAAFSPEERNLYVCPIKTCRLAFNTPQLLADHASEHAQDFAAGIKSHPTLISKVPKEGKATEEDEAAVESYIRRKLK